MMLLAGCSQKPVATPRAHAYPRIELYPATYRSVALPFGPDSLTVNDSVVVEIRPNGWINMEYPAYGVTVNATLSPYSEDTMNNRRERISRNIGEARAEIAQLPAGIIIVAPGALRTPVQLLAADSAKWILSAVAVSSFPADAAVDSVAPIINAIARDFSIMLKDLSE